MKTICIAHGTIGILGGVLAATGFVALISPLTSMAILAQSSSIGCLKLLLHPDFGDKARPAIIIGVDDNPAQPLALKPINYFQWSVRRSGGKARAEVSRFCPQGHGELQEALI